MEEQENRTKDTNTQVDKEELGDNSQKLEAKSKDSSGLGTVSYTHLRAHET